MVIRICYRTCGKRETPSTPKNVWSTSEVSWSTTGVQGEYSGVSIEYKLPESQLFPLGSKTGILKSIVFHKIPTVEFDFAAISVTICDGGVAQMSVLGPNFLPLHFNTPFSSCFTKSFIALSRPTENQIEKFP
jgi:hypothetical protein